ncbi:MAG: winged helix-turn-helix domain-containing protein [Pseudomonadota bacterium]
MAVKERIVIELGEWTVDSLALSISNGNDEHHVPAKVMAVLVYLAENHGRLVTRQELIDSIWDGNTYVGEKTLTNAIWRIRQALGRDADDVEFIKTTPKIGYQLVPVPCFRNPGDDEAAPATRPALSLTYVAVAALALGLAAVWLFAGADRGFRPAEESPLIMTQLPGRELYPAPSPDGSQFAFMHVSQAGAQDLYVQSFEDADRQPERFTAGGTSNYSPSWAPDSRHLAYIRIDDQSRRCEVVIRDMQLGEEYPADVCVAVDQRTLSWSPDGRWLVYRKADPVLGPGLYLKAMNLDARPRGELQDRRISCTDCALTDQEVSWSPDSRALAVTRTKNRMSEDIHLFDIDEWQFSRLTFGESSIEGHVWDREGQNLLYVSDRHSLNRRIWAVNLPTGNKREIGYEGAGFPVFLPNYESIMFYRRRANAHIAAIPIEGGDGASHFPSVIVQTSGSERNPSYSHVANKLAYYSNVSGHNEIWIADPDGSNRRQITSLKTSAIDPSWSPGGDKIVFVAFEPYTESLSVRIYDLLSDTQHTVSTGFDDFGSPTFASDGRSLIVPVYRGEDGVDLWRVSIDGNQFNRITHNGAEFGRESADGRYLHYSKQGARGLFRMSLADGEESLLISDVMSTGYGNWTWAGSDKVLYARHQDGHSEIVRYDLDSGARNVVVKHPGRTIHRFGMLSYSDAHGLLYFTHREPQQIDILMAPNPLPAAPKGK